MKNQEYNRDSYTISTDPSRLDIPFIHQFLSQNAYWAIDRPVEVVQQSIQNSLNFGVYDGERQVGFARVVTDYATFAWLCDVFIVPECRQVGLGKWLIECVVSHPDLAPVRRIILATRDAHGLYRKYGGFLPLSKPERWMERVNF